MSTRSPRLATLARTIEEEWPELSVEIVEGYCNTDSKIAGTHFRRRGKGRTGNRLIVRKRDTGTVVLDHNAAETYRENSEVVEWIEARRRGWNRWRAMLVDQEELR